VLDRCTDLPGLVIRVEISRRGPGSLESAARLQQRLQRLAVRFRALDATIELRLLQVSQPTEHARSTNCAPESRFRWTVYDTLHFFDAQDRRASLESNRARMGAKSSNSRSSTVYEQCLSSFDTIVSRSCRCNFFYKCRAGGAKFGSIIFLRSLGLRTGNDHPLSLRTASHAAIQRTPTGVPDLGDVFS